MRLLITIGMLIIFISVFFILLMGSSIINNAFQCTPIEGGYDCTYSGLSQSDLISFLIMFFFILIDVITVFMIVSSLRVSGKA